MRALRVAGLVTAAVVAVALSPLAVRACGMGTDFAMSTSAGPAGSVVTASGVGFASTTVTIHWGNASGPVLATASGPSFRVPLTIPQVPAGYYYVDAWDGVDQMYVDKVFQVTAPPTTSAPAPTPAPTTTSRPTPMPLPLTTSVPALPVVHRPAATPSLSSTPTPPSTASLVPRVTSVTVPPSPVAAVVTPPVADPPPASPAAAPAAEAVAPTPASSRIPSAGPTAAGALGLLAVTAGTAFTVRRHRARRGH